MRLKGKTNKVTVKKQDRGMEKYEQIETYKRAKEVNWNCIYPIRKMSTYPLSFFGISLNTKCGNIFFSTSYPYNCMHTPHSQLLPKDF